MIKKLLPLVLVVVVMVMPIINTAAYNSDSVVNVNVDPRMELLTIVQYLSGYFLLSNLDLQYKKDINQYFKHYQEHMAIKLFREMSSPGNGFILGAPPETMLYLSNPPELKINIPYTEFLIMRAGGREKIDKFVLALRDFAKKTKFNTFYQEHHQMYSQVIKDVKLKIKPEYLVDLEKYFGMKQHSYYLILAPLLHRGGFGPRVQSQIGSYDVYSICGPQDIKNGLLDFGDEELLQHLVWHEFAHSFINPITEKYQDKILKIAPNFTPLLPELKQTGYQGDLEEIVNEHLVRAIDIRLAYYQFGESFSLQMLENEERQGFRYMKALCRQLEEYEKQRDRYSTIEAFYPKLFEVFQSNIATDHQ